MQHVPGSANKHFSIVWNVSRLSSFPSYALSSSHFLFISVSSRILWQCVDLKRSYARNIFTRTQFLLKRIKTFLLHLLLFQIYISRGLSWSLEPSTRQTWDATTLSFRLRLFTLCLRLLHMCLLISKVYCHRHCRRHRSYGSFELTPKSKRTFSTDPLFFMNNTSSSLFQRN